MKNTKRMKKHECLGGPLCGEYMRAPGPNSIGIPAIKWEDDDGLKHVYRLARSGDRTFWHYMGVCDSLDTNKPIRFRPLPPID